MSDAITLLYLTIQLYLALILRRTRISKAHAYKKQDSPTLLVAVRNEASYLPTFLESLKQQSWYLQVRFGEDSSTDLTAILLQKAIQENPRWWVHVIPTLVHKRYPAKHGVLVYLEQYLSESEPYFLLSDADMVFLSNWAQYLCTAFASRPELGAVCGPSLPRARNIWEGFQRIEWAATLYLIAAAQKHGLVPTAIGNNMAVRRSAWQSIGGWKSLRPTLVEDYAFKAALEAAGWQFRWVFHPAVVGETRAEPSLRSWFQQRLRWAKAVKNPPLMAWLYWLLQTTLPWILLFSGKILLLLPSWLIAEALPLLRLRAVLQVRKVLRYLPFLLVYRFFQGPFFLRLATSRGKITWRGRIYPANL